MKLLFLGGDRRMTVAYDILSKKYECSSWGLFDNDYCDIKWADVVILPIPTTRDNKYINTPNQKVKIPLDILKDAKRGTLILTAGYDAERYPQVDYASLDDFCIKNAISTAEGAIAAAIEKTDCTLFGSKILVAGYGRVGKILLSRLLSFGADITQSARRDVHFAELDALGVKHIDTKNIKDCADNFDIIFNTLDIDIFGDKIPKKTIIFDLSTKGCTQKAAENIIKLPGIPGKTAPLSAGEIIASTVEKIISAKQ